MKKSYLRVLSLCALCLVTACGGGGSQGLMAPVATHFSVSAPTKAVAGTELQISVTALDATNSVVASYAGTVHFSSSDGHAVLPANSTLTNGSGTFPATLQTAGSATITATDTVTTSITGTSSSIAVGAGPATHFAVAAPPAPQSGVAFGFTVTALDATNNVASSYTGTVHFSSTDARAVLPANATLTDGTGPFAATLQTAGNQTLTATDVVTASITGTSSSIDVDAGPATHFAVSAPPASQVGETFNFTVTGLDAASNVANGYSGTMYFSSTDGQAVLPANSPLTKGAGTFPAILNTVGSQTISATDTVTASITGNSSPINVTEAPPPFHFSVSAPSTAQAGTAFKFTVTALNTGNGVASNYAGTVQFSSSDGQALLPANSTLTNGMGSFSTTLETAGSQTITATDTVTASIMGTSSSIEVSPGPTTHFSVTGRSIARSGTAFGVIVNALDAANNVADSYAGTVEFSSTDPKAALPANSPLTDGTGNFSVTLNTDGSQSITATDTVAASITGTSNTIEVFSGCQIQGEFCSTKQGSHDACCPGLYCNTGEGSGGHPIPVCE